MIIFKAIILTLWFIAGLINIFLLCINETEELMVVGMLFNIIPLILIISYEEAYELELF